MSEAGSWARLQPRRIVAVHHPGAPASDGDPCALAGDGGLPRELKALLAQARESGLCEGERRGHARGHREGLAQGHAAGFEAGLAQGRSEGEAQGRAAGFEAGHAQALDGTGASLRAAADRFGALAASLTQAWAHSQEAVAKDLVELAQALAQQVLGEALQADPARVLALVRALLQDEPALSGQPQLLLHPGDLALVQAHLHDELQAAGWRLRADACLEPGGCVVRAASGELDARRATRWQRVAQALACVPDASGASDTSLAPDSFSPDPLSE